MLWIKFYAITSNFVWQLLAEIYKNPYWATSNKKCTDLIGIQILSNKIEVHVYCNFIH